MEVHAVCTVWTLVEDGIEGRDVVGVIDNLV